MTRPQCFDGTRDPRRLIFLRKKWTGTTGWSDAIQDFYESAAMQFSETILVEVSIGSLGDLRSSYSALKSAAAAGPQTGLVIIVNHSICWWALAPTLVRLKLSGATVVLCMHEHEHILGMSYVRQHYAHLTRKELLRHSRLYHGIAARAVSRVIVLAEAQAAVLGIHDAIRCSYLPVNPELFPADMTGTRVHGAPPVVLFAHDPNRFDKGHRFVDEVGEQLSNQVDWVYGRERVLPFDQVYKKYWDTDIVFLPSDWESYSLVFIEALACNKRIVCSPYVGAAKLLQSKYSNIELAERGVYVTAHEAPAYAASLSLAASRVSVGNLPRTRALFEEFNFGRVHLPVELI